MDGPIPTGQQSTTVLHRTTGNREVSSCSTASKGSADYSAQQDRLIEEGVLRLRSPGYGVRAISSPAASVQVEPERLAGHQQAARAHGVQRANHAAVATERLVGERDDQPVRRCDRRGGADALRDLVL